MIIESVNKAVKTSTAHAVWNTGRGYSDQNQRMSAQILADGRVAFVDVDRGLDGVCRNPYDGEIIGETESNPALLAKFVMREYDESRYNSGFYELEKEGGSFEEVHALATRLKAAAKSIGPDGVRLPQAHELPGVSDAAIAVLQTYPATAIVADLYDDAQEFADALNQLVGSSFEYPDYSHKRIGDVIGTAERASTQQSRWDAEAIAREKRQVTYVDAALDQAYMGKVMGVTGSHTVLNLGRAALIVKTSDLSYSPEKGADVTFKFADGKGQVCEREVASEIER